VIVIQHKVSLPSTLQLVLQVKGRTITITITITGDPKHKISPPLPSTAG